MEPTANEMLDWIEEKDPRWEIDYSILPIQHVISYYGNNDCKHIIYGESLRDCVTKAMKEEG